MHYKRWKRTGDPTKTIIRKREDEYPDCIVDGCNNKATHNLRKDTDTEPMCPKHYIRWKKYGDPNKLKRENYGSGWITSNGYKRLYCNGDYNFEHRMVMEEMIGRKLERHEHVHHKNGVKLDNSPDNLELWVSSHPSGQRIDELIEWSIEILQKYKPDVLR